jgi:hypothetical protein
VGVVAGDLAVGGLGIGVDGQASLGADLGAIGPADRPELEDPCRLAGVAVDVTATALDVLDRIDP